MRLFVLIFSLFFFSCSYFDKHEDEDTINSIESIKVKRDFYVSLIGTNPRAITTRCDGLTFIGLYDAFGRKINIYDYEYPNGKWNRDIEPCYPDHSRSEISAEGIFGMLHSMLTRKDRAALDRFTGFLEANGFRAGAGPVEYTGMLHLLPLINKVRDWTGRSFSKSNVPSLTREPTDVSKEEFPPISGYRGNVIADYLYLRGRVNGYLLGYELEILEKLCSEVPQNPIYHALYHRFTDGDQSRAIDILSGDEFPKYALPEKSLPLFDWSDAPSAILYIYTVAIIEGR